MLYYELKGENKNTHIKYFIEPSQNKSDIELLRTVFNDNKQIKIEFSEGIWKTECTNCDSELKIKMAMNKAYEEINVLTNRYKKISK